MDSMSCLRGMFLLKSVCASEVELFIVSQHFAAAPFANGNCSEKKLLVGEISVLVFGRCHFMYPSLHSICVICRKPWHSLCRLIFYASKYNLVSGMVSLHHIWRISFFNAWPAALGKMPFHAESITVKNGRELISPTKN